MLSALDRALLRAGHRSIVVAQEGSECAGTLVSVPQWKEVDGDARRRAWRAHRRSIEETLRRFPVDIVHYHGLDFASYAPRHGPSAVATLHLPPSWYAEDTLRLDHTRFHLCCVSSSQRWRCPSVSALCAMVPNGVDLETFRPSPGKEDFLLALGRICPEKGFHHALDAARLAGASLLLGGEVFPYPQHRAYFETEIEPRLDPKRRFLGPVDLDRKRELLSRARAVLIPSLVPETSSLVAMEALASGTPVIAFPAGALAEIVEEGRTGFLVSDVMEMADAIARIPEIAGESCRRAAVRGFSEKDMIDGYLRLYDQVLAGEHPRS